MVRISDPVSVRACHCERFSNKKLPAVRGAGDAAIRSMKLFDVNEPVNCGISWEAKTPTFCTRYGAK